MEKFLFLCIYIVSFASLLHSLRLTAVFNLLQWKIRKTRDKRKHWRKIYLKKNVSYLLRRNAFHHGFSVSFTSNFFHVLFRFFSIFVNFSGGYSGLCGSFVTYSSGIFAYRLCITEVNRMKETYAPKMFKILFLNVNQKKERKRKFERCIRRMKNILNWF